MKQLLGSVVCLDLKISNPTYSTITDIDCGLRVAELTINGLGGSDKIIISLVDLNHPDRHLIAKWYAVKEEFKSLPMKALQVEHFSTLFELIASRRLYEKQ